MILLAGCACVMISTIAIAAPDSMQNRMTPPSNEMQDGMMPNDMMPDMQGQNRDQQPTMQGREGQHDLRTRLNLTKEQRKQARDIRRAGEAKIRPLMDKMEDLRDEMDEVRAQNMEEFEKILTPEQKEILKEEKNSFPQYNEDKTKGPTKGKGKRNK